MTRTLIALFSLLAALSPNAGRSVAPRSSLGNVNARGAPGTDQQILAMLPNDTPLRILGEQTVNGEAWNQVEIPGGAAAWIRSDLLFYTD